MSIQSSPLGWFWTLAVVDGAAVSMMAQVSPWSIVLKSFGSMSRRGIAEPRGKSISSCLKKSHCFLQRPHFHSCWQRGPLSPPSAGVYYSLPWIVAVLTEVTRHLIVVLIRISRMTSHVEQFFSYICWLSLYSLDNCLEVLCPLLIWIGWLSVEFFLKSLIYFVY